MPDFAFIFFVALVILIALADKGPPHD